MKNFTLIASDLPIDAALAQLEKQPDYHWVDLIGNASRFIPLLGGEDERQFLSALPAVWRLIDEVRDRAALQHGDCGTVRHARVGLMPPACGLPPHFDGIDGLRARRYQIALRSEPGVRLTVGGEAKTPAPGEAWWIDASRTHSVINGSAVDRITILFDTEELG